MAKHIIVGAGNFGRELVHWIIRTGVQFNNGAKYSDLVFLDDEKTSLRGYYSRIPIHKIAEWEVSKDDVFHMGISDPRGKKVVSLDLTNRGATFNGPLPSSLIIAGDVLMGRGCVFCPFTVISAAATLGNFVTVNTHTGIGHDVMIGDYCTLSSNIDVCGKVIIEEGVFIGSSAVILPGVKIGAWARIGAGAIVARDVESGTTVYASPARKLK
jgi:sugar O-acyltransferase (sialic acid O-acetyltransferase NeuD family)